MGARVKDPISEPTADGHPPSSGNSNPMPPLVILICESVKVNSVGIFSDLVPQFA